MAAKITFGRTIYGATAANSLKASFIISVILFRGLCILLRLGISMGGVWASQVRCIAL